MKRFVVPHQKLSGSGGTAWLSGWDSYIPTGRLIIVDRTTFSREWVDAEGRGTSAKKEGFPCQSREGLNITAGISIGASVSEANAARYLFHFGVLSPISIGKDGVAAQRNDPQIIFTSVYYSRKLSSVMDDVGRKMVQTLVCSELSLRSLDEDNSQAGQIMDVVRTRRRATTLLRWGSLSTLSGGQTHSRSTKIFKPLSIAAILPLKIRQLQKLSHLTSTPSPRWRMRRL